MASPATSTKARRWRWALLIALSLHLMLLVRYSPSLFQRFATAHRATAIARPPSPPKEEIVEISPPPPPPKSRGMVLATTLGKGSPEQLSPTLPPGFFDRLQSLPKTMLQPAADLGFSRASGLQIVADIVPAALRTGRPTRVADAAHKAVPTPRVAAETRAPLRAPPNQEPGAAVADDHQEPVAPASGPDEARVPFSLPPTEPAYDVDAAIARAAAAAEQTARDHGSAAAKQPLPDYRAMLPAGAVIKAPPLPLGGDRVASSARLSDEPLGSFALEAPVDHPPQRSSLGVLKGAAAERQQFFGTLTARLRASNVKRLAEAIKAGPKAIVRMRFLLDRSGRVLGVAAAPQVEPALAEQAAAVIRAAPLPPVPETMTEVPVELSYPVEVYR